VLAIACVVDHRVVGVERHEPGSVFAARRVTAARASRYTMIASARCSAELRTQWRALERAGGVAATGGVDGATGGAGVAGGVTGATGLGGAGELGSGARGVEAQPRASTAIRVAATAPSLCIDSSSGIRPRGRELYCTAARCHASAARRSAVAS
jgi:hypothetical protein